MVVPKELLNSVIFIGQATARGERLGGTGYFVSVPGHLDPRKGFVYLVTARHCVAGRTNLIARVNNTADIGGTVTVALPDGEHWYTYDEPSPGEDYVDLVAIGWPDPTGMFEAGYQAIPATMFFDEAALLDDPSHGVGLGDEVVAVGLLTVHSATVRNAPVVRTGNLWRSCCSRG